MFFKAESSVLPHLICGLVTCHAVCAAALRGPHVALHSVAGAFSRDWQVFSTRHPS